MPATYYHYLACATCSCKQYIGGNLHLATETIERLLEVLTEPLVGEDQHVESVIGIQGLAGSLLLALKFLKLHGGHQVFLWTPQDLNESPALWEETWKYDPASQEFHTPVWKDIEPLGTPDLEKELRAVITDQRLSIEQITLQNFDLQARLFKDNESMIARLREQMRSFATENGFATLYSSLSPQTIESSAGIMAPPTLDNFTEVQLKAMVLAEQYAKDGLARELTELNSVDI